MGSHQYFGTSKGLEAKYRGCFDPTAECGHLGSRGACSATDRSVTGVCRLYAFLYRRGHLLMATEFIKGW
jgi:hypothetical protein